MIVYKNQFTNQLALAAAALFTVESNSTERIIKAVVCNDTTTTVTYTFYLVPTGRAADATTMIVNQVVLGDKQSAQVWQIEGAVLNGGGALWGVASVANQVTCHISTVKVT